MTVEDKQRCNECWANLVILMGLKVGQGRVAGGGEGHDFNPSVHQALIIQLLEHPP